MKRQIRYAISLIAFLITSIIIAFSRHINFPAQFDLNRHNNYVVSRVIDGDTIELSNGESVRYIGIDTPEIRKRKGSAWVYDPMPYAEEAKAFNKSFVEGRSVRLEFDAQKKDKYRRLLAYAYLGDKMVNLEMVREGYAMIYTYPPNVKYAQRFLEAQKEARVNKRGLWAELDSESAIISPGQAKQNIGKVRVVEAEVKDTYLTEKMLILKFNDSFKAVIYKNNIPQSFKGALRSPDSYFKGKLVRVYGIIKEYKGHPEIVLHDISQLEILK